MAPPPHLRFCPLTPLPPHPQEGEQGWEEVIAIHCAFEPVPWVT